MPFYSVELRGRGSSIPGLVSSTHSSQLAANQRAIRIARSLTALGRRRIEVGIREHASKRFPTHGAYKSVT